MLDLPCNRSGAQGPSTMSSLPPTLSFCRLQNEQPKLASFVAQKQANDVCGCQSVVLGDGTSERHLFSCEANVQLFFSHGIANGST